LAIRSPDSIIHLQSTIGNQAVQKLMLSNVKFDFAKIGIQPKMKVSQHGDNYEEEADRVSEILNMPQASLRGGSASDFPISNLEHVSHKHLDSNDVHPVVGKALQSSSQSLDSATREYMESRFGYKFSDVRIHTSIAAAESARVVDALAYTVDRDISFDAGQYAPSTYSGRRLLAHELSHVIQQGRVGIPLHIARQPVVTEPAVTP
jgi:hypothetical protein